MYLQALCQIDRLDRLQAMRVPRCIALRFALPRPMPTGLRLGPLSPASRERERGSGALTLAVPRTPSGGRDAPGARFQCVSLYQSVCILFFFLLLHLEEEEEEEEEGEG